MMNEYKTELTPDGQERREAILADVLVASATRVQRRRRVRIRLSVAAVVLIAVSIGILMRSGSEEPIARPEPRHKEQRPPEKIITPTVQKDRAIIVEELSTEQLLAQLNEAELSYVVIDGEEILLVPTDFDPWDMSKTVEKKR